ncbi:MAG: ComEC/Rec2 family competence protein [Candidatus Paceibacteria bacterium]
MPRTLIFAIFGLFLANFAAYSYIFAFLKEPELSVHFLNVGQGDAEIVRTNRSTILIDAGPSSKVIGEIDSVLLPYDRTIDIAILSHPNYDHLAGFLPVLSRYRVRLFMMTGASHTISEYQKLKQELNNLKIPVLYAMAGERIILKRSELLLLYPERPLLYEKIPPKSLNDTSIVAWLYHPALSVLFTGDISSKVEKILQISTSTVLKVPHHGSKYSSSEEFMKKVLPKYAVIEVGRNSYGHPTQEALSRLAAVGAKVFRTDVDGTVSFFVEDRVVKIRTK